MAGSPPSVEAILSRDSFTLEQLLAEDELVKVLLLQLLM